MIFSKRWNVTKAKADIALVCLAVIGENLVLNIV
jgi:hypothetical protein